MILSDRDIQKAMGRPFGALVIDPPFTKQRLQPASIELTLAEDLLFETALSYLTHPDGSRTEWGGGFIPEKWCDQKECDADDCIRIRKGDFILASTQETVHIPNDVVGLVNGKSSLGRRGLVIHQTAGFIDPGFKGQITLELTMVSNKPLRLHAGQPICQLVLMRLTSAAERPYGSDGLGSHYQGQQGPTPAAG